METRYSRTAFQTRLITDTDHSRVACSTIRRITSTAGPLGTQSISSTSKTSSNLITTRRSWRSGRRSSTTHQSTSRSANTSLWRVKILRVFKSRKKTMCGRRLSAPPRSWTKHSNQIRMWFSSSPLTRAGATKASPWWRGSRTPTWNHTYSSAAPSHRYNIKTISQ